MKRRRQIKRGVLANTAQQPGGTHAELLLEKPDQVHDAVRHESGRFIPPVIESHILGLAATLDGIEEEYGAVIGEAAGERIGEIVASGILNELVAPIEMPKPVQRQPWVPQPGGPTGRKGKPPITEDIRLEIARAYEAGEPVLTIARRFDVARGTVLNISKELGAARPTVTPTEPVEEITMPPAKPTTVPHDMPLPVTSNGTRIIDVSEGKNEYVVSYEVVVQKTLTVRADNVGQAFVHANKALFDVDGAEIINVARA